MSHIDFLARFAYSTGQDPVDYAAENVIGAHVCAHLMVGVVLANGSFPCTECGADLAVNPCGGCARDLSVGGLACRIIGDLMNAGWTPPEAAK